MTASPMTNEETTKKKITPKKVFLCILAAALIVLAAIFLPPFIKDRIFEYKVKKSLVSAYPGAKISRVKYLKPETQDGFWHDYLIQWRDCEWPEEPLYLCEVYPVFEEVNNPVVKCLATKDGKVVFDEYAFFHYREELKSYVMGILEPEKNFPGINFVYYDLRNARGGRLVLTEKCTSFEAYLSKEGAGFSAMSDNTQGNASCIIQIGIDSYGDDKELEVCKKLSDIFINADCKVRIKFIEELDGKRSGSTIAYYNPEAYTWEHNGKTFKTERFEPQNKKIQEKWN